MRYVSKVWIKTGKKIELSDSRKIGVCEQQVNRKRFLWKARLTHLQLELLQSPQYQTASQDDDQSRDLLAPIVWSYLTLSSPVALGHTLAPSPHKSQNLNFTFFVPSLGTLKHYKIIFLINRVRKMSPLRGHEPKFLHLNKAKNWLNSESSPVVERGHRITSTLPRDLIVSSFPVYLLGRHFIKSSKVGPVQ